MASRYRAYLQLLLVLLGLAVVLLISGFAVSRKLGGAGAVTGMLWACGLSWLAAVVGGLPLLVARSTPQEVGTLALGSMAIRMGVTLFGALAVVLGTDIPRTPFLLWLVASYIVFLIADVFFLVARNRN